MLEAILGAIPGCIIDLVKFIFQMGKKKSEKFPSRQEYESLRRMAAEALTMNACYYCNPVDIAQHGDKLPEAYERGSTQLRELGAKFRSFAETLPERTHDIPLSKEQIAQVGSSFIGLSNSFNTPYRCPRDREDVLAAKEMEATIRSLLDISKIE